MAKERKKAPDDDNGAPSKRDDAVSASESESGSGSENDSRRSEGSRDSRRSQSKRKRSRSSSRKSREDDEDSYSSLSESESESYSDSYSDSESRSSEEYSDSELEERRRRRRKERRKTEEREKEKEKKRRRRKEKEKKRRRKEREEKEEKRRRKNHKEKKKKKKKKRDKEKGKQGAVTNSWGKYGIIRETDMWNKRPEFTAWLAEVKQVNLESLPNWEEKQMFKEFMEDHNTATFPSRKYYNLDAYHRRKMEKEMMRGPRKVLETERTIFNDEEQRRLELLRERERQKELEVEALKRSMQGGLAQAMKEQAQLKEEMAYQYKIGNFEAAAAIQRRLDPDIPM